MAEDDDAGRVLTRRQTQVGSGGEDDNEGDDVKVSCRNKEIIDNNNNNNNSDSINDNDDDDDDQVEKKRQITTTTRVSSSSSATCPLEYPEKFEATRRFVAQRARLEHAHALTEDHLLALHAFGEQVDKGPCVDASPWAWNVEERAKWTIYSQLGNMGKYEAMYRYVQLVELDCPRWWQELRRDEQLQAKNKKNLQQQSASSSSAFSAPANKARGAYDDIKILCATKGHNASANGGKEKQQAAWRRVTLEGETPLPRYEHASCVIRNTFVVVGGNSGRRLLGDMHAFDLNRGLQHFDAAIDQGENGSADQGQRSAYNLENLPRWRKVRTAVMPSPQHEQQQQQQHQRQEKNIGGNDEDGSAAANNTTKEEDACSSSNDMSHKAPHQPRQQNMTAFPPVAGLALVAWGDDMLLAVGGRQRSSSNNNPMDLQVYTLDASTISSSEDSDGAVAAWRLLECSPDANAGMPPARRLHSATIDNDRLWIFGGEGVHNDSLDDLWCLDLKAQTWIFPASTGKPPAARSSHTATVYNGQLHVFGGCSHRSNAFFNSVHTCTLDTMTWKENVTFGESAPAPRAGHASTTFGPFWFIAGGGNNTMGLGDCMALDMRTMSWIAVCPSPTVITTIAKKRVQQDKQAQIPSVAYEGMSLVCVPCSADDGAQFSAALFAFGGYNGRTTASLRLFDLGAAATEGGGDGNDGGNNGLRKEQSSGASEQQRIAASIQKAAKHAAAKISEAEDAVQSLAERARPRERDAGDVHLTTAATMALHAELDERSELVNVVTASSSLRALFSKIAAMMSG